jgi:acetate kinase
MHGCVAVINAGSSSIKFALYDADNDLALLFRGQIESIGRDASLKVVNQRGDTVMERSWASGALDHRGAVEEILRIGPQLVSGSVIQAVGHRVVHGGVEFAAPTRVDPQVMEALEKLVPLAPLHQPHNLAAIRIIAAAVPRLPQIACFDTAFHRSQPPLAQSFALPRKLSDEGVRRYGFHGLSYEYIATQLRSLDPALAAGRAIVAHLGNGASLCAVQAGRSIASTMGFTAVDGLMMGTRCGALDPGVILYLIDQKGMNARAIEKLIYQQSGLLGVSGISSDMRTLRRSTAAEAREAIDLFIYRIAREIGSLAAALGGVDGLVFTGGIGENDAQTRSEVAAQCRWLGLELDDVRIAPKTGVISTKGSRMSCWVIPTDEERMIAQHTVSLLTAEVEAPRVA